MDQGLPLEIRVNNRLVMAVMVASHFLKLAVISSLFALSSWAYEVPVIDTGSWKFLASISLYCAD